MSISLARAFADWPAGRLVRAAAAVSLAGGGLAFAFEAAHELVDHQNRGYAAVLGLLAALCFVGASMLTLRAAEALRPWGVIHWLVLWILATVTVIAFGYFVVRWTQRQSVPVRVLAQFGVAIVAGASAVLPAVISTIFVSYALRGGAATTSDLLRGRLPRLSRWLENRSEQWSFPPWTRLLALLVRTVGMSVGGMTLSLAGQASAYPASASSRAASVFVPAACWLVGSAAGWIAVGKLIRFSPSVHRSRHVSHGLGVAWLAVSLATALVAGQTAHSATAKLLGHDRTLVYGSDASQVSPNLDDQALANAFAPDVRFTSHEPWHPTSVNWYLRHTTLTRNGSGCKNGCRALSCDNLNDGCTQDAPANPTIYALVKRVPPGLFPAPYDDVSTIIQYWFFYNYDSLPRWLVSQWHQGDWEELTVGLAGAQPRFVGYSEHCFGTWLPWQDVPVTNLTHPISFVAEGTHANYPRPLQAPLRGAACAADVTPPTYTGASGLALGVVQTAGSVEVAGDYALGETDHTGDVAGALAVKVINPSGSIAAFPGRWGRDNLLSVAGGKPSRHGPGPGSPAEQGVWRDPISNIVCNQKWFTPVRLRCRVPTH